MLKNMCDILQREKTGYSMFVSRGSGRSSPSRDQCCLSGDVSGGSGTCLWCFPAIRQRVAPLLAGERHARSSVSAARPTFGHSIGTMAGCHDRTFDHRPLSGPAQAAVCTLDARSGSGSHYPSVWHSAFRLDSGAVSRPLGFHATKTPSAGLRAGPRGGAALADQGVSVHPDLRQTSGSHDLLGRRGGDAVRPSSRHLLWTARRNPCDPGDGATLPLQLDLRPHQPRKAGLHGLRREVHRLRIYRVPEAADPSCGTQSLSHRRRASSACVRAREAVAGTPSAADLPLFSAGLQPGSQPRRVAQSRCQEQRSGTEASTQQEGDGGKREELLVEYPAPTPKGKGLLPAPESPVCRVRCKTFSAPLSNSLETIGRPITKEVKNASESLRPKIDHNIDEQFSRLIDQKIAPWAFFNTGKMPQITDYHGRTIKYSGVKFEGSPNLVFWHSFIDPFIRSIIVESIEWGIKLADSANIPTLTVLEMIGSRLKMQIHKTYTYMSEIDQRIRGEGYPERVQRRDVSDKVNSMCAFLEEHILSAKQIYHQGFSLNRLYHEHPFWFWLIGTVIAVILGIITIR